MNGFKVAWNKSYSKKENNILYPYEDLVKFLKRNPIKGRKSALEYGCGIGRQTYLLSECGFETIGLDFSKKAIQRARKLIKVKRNKPVFKLCDGETIKLKERFDLVVCLGTLDSMPLKDARNILLQLGELSKRYLFLSFIQGDKYSQEIKKDYEKDTCQTYHNKGSVRKLISLLNSFELIDFYVIETKSLIDKSVSGRFYVTLKRLAERCGSDDK